MAVTARIVMEQTSRADLVIKRMERKAGQVAGDTIDAIYYGAVVGAPLGNRVYVRNGESHPGHLKASHTRTYTRGQKKGSVDVGADYGVYVHNGTRHQRAQPWLLTAAKAARVVWKAGLKRIFRP